METKNSPFTNPKLVGNEKISGIPVAIQEGYVTMGYVADKIIPFGAVCKEVAKTNKCTLGTSSVISEIAGVAVYDSSIVGRRPACSDSYLPSMQCSILIKGLVWYHVDDTTDLSKGVKVFASKKNGDVQFSATSPTSDYIECAFMHIVRIDRLANAVLVYVDILACEQATGTMPSVEPWAVTGNGAKIPSNKVDGITKTAQGHEFGEHDDQVAVLHGNEAYLGEKNSSADNRIMTDSDVKVLFNPLNNKATALETRLASAEGAIDMLQADVGTLKEKVEKLITNYTALEQRVTALETPKA